MMVTMLPQLTTWFQVAAKMLALPARDTGWYFCGHEEAEETQRPTAACHTHRGPAQRTGVGIRERHEVRTHAGQEARRAARLRHDPDREVRGAAGVGTVCPDDRGHRPGGKGPTGSARRSEERR